ncbi:hypothetical protein OVY01_18410 [Robbsia sp. Bb-Pol-6]|uniref:Uncharacterized protein n=1 Tax=Robbsia betulipollinis TaxID=2981849 RepID=A0ABT3ZRE8_9BURK|nr:hypothetical protein [Robbsia betulipollinis]MCY0389125.1 hypothetical protein [Robbsia betulipollinis]
MIYFNIFLLVIVAILIQQYRSISASYKKEKAALAELSLRFENIQREIELNATASTHTISEIKAQLLATEAERASLMQFSEVRDAAAEAKLLLEGAAAALAAAEQKATAGIARASEQATQLLAETNIAAKAKRSEAEQLVALASRQADKVISDAKKRAEEIGGDAIRALENADRLEATIVAMKMSSTDMATVIWCQAIVCLTNWQKAIHIQRLVKVSS